MEKNKYQKMNTDPCLSTWLQYQKCLTYNYPEKCLELINNFNQCRLKSMKKFEINKLSPNNVNEKNKNVSYGIEDETQCNFTL